MPPILAENDPEISLACYSQEFSVSEHLKQPERTAYEVFLSGKRVLKESDGFISFKESLSHQLNALTGKEIQAEEETRDDIVNDIILENWVDEILKFLTLKTVLNDLTEPCQLSPGYAIEVGWQSLILVPSIYEQVCKAMGNPTVFELNQINISSPITLTHRERRYNSTLRAYQQHFENQPPDLYWALEKRKVKVAEESLLDKLSIVCGCASNLDSLKNLVQ